MASQDLVELDSLEILVIIDNELDPISPSPNPAVQRWGTMKDIAMNSEQLAPGDRGDAEQILLMEDICCGAHGLSLMITGIKGDQKHTILFDCGPEEAAWERNARRLKADVGVIEAVQLSHWHRDHSGGMLKVLAMIEEARVREKRRLPPVSVDLHPDRPAFRGLQPPGSAPIAWQADPSFEDIERLGGSVHQSDQPHCVLDDFFLVSGEIPRVTAYEKGLKFGIRFDESKQAWEEDTEMKDERLLMCKIKGKGIVVFTGCSHGGVVNAAKYAVELGRGSSLYAVMGGFHLADGQPEQISSTTKDLRDLDVKLLLTGHCTGWRAKFDIQTQMPGRLVPSFVGSEFVLS